MDAAVLIRIDEKDSRPIYQQIVDEVRRALVTGSLRAEDPLPSVRQLAGEIKVNPNTVQQAYRELEREGVVYVRRGQGTFVAAVKEGSSRARTQLALSLAQRALREAYRHGLDVEELIEAIRKAAADGEGRKR
jgi:GntR family transcriptional regulator